MRVGFPDYISMFTTLRPFYTFEIFEISSEILKTSDVWAFGYGLGHFIIVFSTAPLTGNEIRKFLDELARMEHPARPVFINSEFPKGVHDLLSLMNRMVATLNDSYDVLSELQKRTRSRNIRRMAESAIASINSLFAELHI